MHVPIVLKSGNLNFLEPSGPVQACNGIALPILGYVDLRAGRDKTSHASAATRNRTTIFRCSLS